MKINNYYNDIRTLVLYGDNTQKEQSINPYNSKAFFDTKNMFEEPCESYDDYYHIYIANLVECNNNPTHINAKKKRELVFVVWVVGKHGDVNGVLYIPFNKVLTHEVIEKKKDMRGDGCVCVSYNDKIVFDDSIKIICKDSAHYFAKPNDQIRNQNDDITEIEGCIEKEQERLEKYGALFHNSQRLIDLYKSKLEEGYKYRCFAYRYKDVNYKYLMLYNYVDHYEKSPEYVKAEKLTKDLAEINKHWDVDDTIKLLKTYKLTKKRASK